MGTFGLCDYLSKKGIPVKLLNLALYNRKETNALLSHYMNLFQPTHVGIVFHWQETTEGVMDVGEYIKLNFDRVNVICGGFTAGYFGESLLNKWGFVDYIIKGDPERPLELLLKGVKPSKIPNVIYRGKNGISSNKVSYHIDQETLSEISFSEMTHLYDYNLYIKAVEEKLGFPIFIGRGCRFNCRYCGGSTLSYRLHSGRKEPVVRSIKSVIKDLKRIKDFTRNIYMCYENDRFYIKNLFKEIKKEKSLVKTFQLNYGAWQLFDKEFLELYRDSFILDSKEKPVFELSPEVFNDKGRQKVKHNTVPYSIKDLIENQNLVNEYVGDSVNTSIFFSRYHEVSKTYSDMRAEIIGIFRLKHIVLYNNMHNVHVCYDHLSTDIASQYWKTHMENPKNFNTLLSSIKRLNAQEYYNFPVNNLCMYIPETLTETDITRCELLITVLKAFEMYFHEMFHIVFQCLDEHFIDVIEKVISEKYLLMPEDIYKKLEYSEMLSDVTKKIVKEDELMSKVPFLEDMSKLFLKKALSMSRQGSERDRPESNHTTLNRDFISVHEHDYLDLLNFLKRLEKEGTHNLIKEKTVFIFLADDILSMPYATYSETLKVFEEGMSLETYYDLMKKREIFTLSYHERLIQRLLQSNVLS
jgi:hypothetical protein